MAMMMNSYHFSLILKNLTTNEHMNMRYPYLRDEMGRVSNAFDKGCLGNWYDFWTRGALSAVDPYMYTKAYDVYLKKQEEDPIEMKERGEKGKLLSEGEHTDDENV